MAHKVRLLNRSDLPALLSLKQSAGWNQTPADWLRLLEAEPLGCFGVDKDGQIVASTTAYRYGLDMAWIGMVLTAPSHRGQGLARALMNHALNWLTECGVRWAKLDATAMGLELYRSLGFEVECPIERWRREPGDVQIQPDAGVTELSDIPISDAVTFGTDRSGLITRLRQAEAAQLENGAIAMGRPGSEAWYFGPCTGTDASAVKALAAWFVARHAHEPVFWDLLPTENPAAAQLASELGFSPLRKLSRMRKRLLDGPPLTAKPEWTYAISGFEFG